MSNSFEVGRYELKYVVPVAKRDDVLEAIADDVCADPHAGPLADGGFGYRVRSLYFDTENLRDYFERLAELRIRNRLRVRTYGRRGDGQNLFFENKRKSGRWVVKHRARLHDPDRWLAGGSGRADDSGAVAGYGERTFRALVDHGRRRPVTVVHYSREVFVPLRPNDNRVRLTLDRRIRAHHATSRQDLFLDGGVSLLPAGWMVMELKFERLAPGWMLGLRNRLRVSAVPVSKFALSVAQTIRQERTVELRALTPFPVRNRRRCA